MQKQLRNALIFLVVVFALLAIGARLTDAMQVLKTTNPALLVLACSFFILSIIVWLISWAFLIKKRRPLGFKTCLFVGFSAVYGSLTPVQVGADMLRSLWLKQSFGVPYSESISASMVVKGIKFLLIALFSSSLIFLFLVSAKDPLLLMGLFSGFFVVMLAALLFLLPLKKEFGIAISNLFGKIAGFIPPAAKLQSFFKSYSDYLSGLGWKSILTVAVLSACSLLLEFLALFYSFKAIALSIPLASIAILFVLIAILERTPFLPRGIGLVEGMGFAYLSMPFVAAEISLAQIGALLIVFDFVRLVLPAVASLGLHSIMASRGLDYTE